jgi:2-dehydro-3-deoxygluconokinase
MKSKPKSSCAFDAISLGEVMLRFDPGEGRIRTARSFTVWEGGGEYNVARGLRRCFGFTTAVATAFCDNDIGRLAEDFILQGGVDTSLIRWIPYDGIGRAARVGFNFTERGFGVRGAVGISDRGHTAISQVKPGDFDWEYIFGTLGVRLLHTGGIFAALSDTAAEVALEAVQAARRHGTLVSYDLNYRPSLWSAFGGQTRAREVNRAIAPFVDIMMGNEEDFHACLGFETDGDLTEIDIKSYESMACKAMAAFPNFKALCTTLRSVKSATRNDWSALCMVDGKLCQSKQYPDLEILDRVGGGDSFASGFLYGILETGDPQYAVNCGAAHGALAMTTPGDTSMASLKEVEALMGGGSARVQR